jgi:2-keto-3-deoxy-L-rhamnonate aldolase RhmA
MKYLFLTDDPQVAAYVTDCGVHRVFLDLEIRGKVERQGGKDTIISSHRAENIRGVKAAIQSGELLVRTNPLHPGSQDEVDYCIDAGADILMLPMFRSADEVREYCQLVRGRVPVCPLVETHSAVRDLERILRIDGVSEVHFGLNDLHIDLGLRFLFEVVANGVLEKAADLCTRMEKPFGIGGIATLGGGLVPGELVLGEYVRLGSTAVILSRAFHHKAKDLADLQSKVNLPHELAKLAEAQVRLRRRTSVETELDRRRFRQCVRDVVAPSAKAA